MHAKPDLRVFLKWMIAGSGSVITDDYEVQSLGSQFLIFFCDRFYRRTFFFEIEPNV